MSTADTREGHPEPARAPDEVLCRLAKEARALDEAISDAVASTPTPTLDVPLRWVSNAANYGRLWVVIAAALGVVGGSRGRRTAVRALTALSVTSVTANLVLKEILPRRRPLRANVTASRAARMPTSSSFPSGHTASGFAFATAVTAEFPLLAVPLFGLATLVGYSRVHTGVHYPTDVIAGATLGFGVGTVVREATLRVGPLARRSIA